MRRTMMKINLQAYLKGSIEAVEHYQKAFSATLGYHVKNEDNTYMHAEITLDGQTIISISESDEWAISGKNMQFWLTFGDDNEDALKKAYDILKEDGQILYPVGPSDWSKCMADVIDKFGVRWYLCV
ncbi:VOC family protein [Vallitalea pronyensis]|uniref:VOC family protein n=2 Tax=Vallitalea pronyensis TaxID=1348613 RepID=A0A8J8SHV8_9FIRM|nr:VOC family protein [Vallitalea pronyensis]